MGFEHFLHLLGVNLFTCGVDADAAAAQQGQASIGFHPAPVARDGVTHAIDRPESLGRLFRVLVVSCGDCALAGNKAGHAAPRLDLPVVLVEYVAKFPDPEFRGVGAALCGRHRQAEAQPFRSAKTVHEDDLGDMFAQARLYLFTPHDAGRDDRNQAARVPALRVGVQRLQHGFGKSVTDNGDALHLVLVHRIPQFFRVEGWIGQRDDGPARHERADSSNEPGSMHQRARRQSDARKLALLHQGHHFLHGLGNRTQQLLRVELSLAHIIVSPHHALGHAGGTACIYEQQVIGRTLDIERRAVTFYKFFVRKREGSDLRSIADFYKCMNLGQPFLQFKNAVAELGTVNNYLAIGIVEDVENLLGTVTIIDVHVREAALEARGHQFPVFGTVAHVEGYLRPVACTLRAQIARQIVRTLRHFGPANDPVAVNQRRSIFRDRRFDCIKDVAKVPVDHVLIPLSLVATILSVACA